MHAAQGILTATGGMTSHAAVVARGMGKCCVAGASGIIVDKKHRKIIIGGLEIKEGDIITLDGTCGTVILGKAELEEPEMSNDCKTLLKWADEFRVLKVLANADTPEDAKVARDFGAQGIGLCRTEHMFFAEDRIDIMRQMLISETTEEERRALTKLLPIQKKDFIGIFEIMNGLPVIIRLLDAPLHEFLPTFDKKIQVLADEMGMTFEDLKNRVERYHEVNPMLGHRGCRLGITNPEIYKMQVRAIIEAAIAVKVQGITSLPYIEVPLISDVKELILIRRQIQAVIGEYKDKISFPYHIGTMIELPRACVTADQIAEHADFFSFGTNDLTQTTFGISRDDVGRFLPNYLEQGVFLQNPTERIDESGVGELMKICVKLARGKKPDFDIGICGEHGGEPHSIEFCHRINLNSVSCSPYRVPVARLAAAQAALRHKNTFIYHRAAQNLKKKRESIKSPILQEE